MAKGEKEEKSRPAAKYMTEAEFKKEIRSPSGGYLLYGPEDYLKRHYAEKLRETALADSPVPEMNSVSFDEDNYSPSALAEAIATPPLMGPYRFVTVSFSDVSSFSEEERGSMVGALRTLEDNPETVLLFITAAGGFDGGSERRPTALAAEFSAAVKLVEIPLQDEKLLIRWICRHVRDHGLAVGQGAPEEMIKLCGREMFRLVSETEKVCLFEKSRGSGTVTAETVREIAARSPEEGAFELANSIMNGDRARALEAVGRALKRGESPYKLLAGVERVVEDLALASQYVSEGMSPSEIAGKMKIAEYRAKLSVAAVRGVPRERILRLLSLCAETEYGMKSGASSGSAPLERLVFSAAAPRKAAGTWKK